MRRLLPLCFLFISFSAPAQMLMRKAAHSKKTDAAKVTIMDTYLIDFEKSTLTNFLIDSVKTIAGNKKLDWSFFKVVMTTTANDVSWRYDSITRDSSSGLFQLRIRQVPSSPKNSAQKTKGENEKADFSKGITIYCTDNRQKREFKVDSFFELSPVEQR